jgi:hypothetical protein
LHPWPSTITSGHHVAKAVRNSPMEFTSTGPHSCQEFAVRCICALRSVIVYAIIITRGSRPLCVSMDFTAGRGPEHASGINLMPLLQQHIASACQTGGAHRALTATFESCMGNPPMRVQQYSSTLFNRLALDNHTILLPSFHSFPISLSTPLLRLRASPTLLPYCSKAPI